LLLALSAPRLAAAQCSGSTYSYGSGACASCAAGASFLNISFDLSRIGVGSGVGGGPAPVVSGASGPPTRAGHGDMPVLEDNAEVMSASAAAFAPAATLQRDLELFHYNGLSSLVGARPRQPRLTRLLLQQRDSGGGGAPGGASADALAMDEAQRGLGGIEEQTRLAMQLSLMASGGGGSGGGGGSAASSDAAAVALAGGLGADGGPAPGSAAAARASAAIESLLRTKWPGASVVFVDGSPPSLD
jgi:hypothetical protein